MTRAQFIFGLEWGRLQFRYDKAAVEAVKQVPGAKWDAGARCWKLPTHAMPAMRAMLSHVLKIDYLAEQVQLPPVVLPPKVKQTLRPYQLQGAVEAATMPGFLLMFDLRTGKTITALGAAAGLMTMGSIDSMLVLYPTSVEGEWVRQPKQWIDLEATVLEGNSPLSDAEVDKLAQRPYLLLGCSYELLGKRGPCIQKVLARRRFAVVADEVQNCKNRKSKRFEQLQEIVRMPGCTRRIGTTGTAMRNRPADMWAVFDFLTPDSMGTFHKFCVRYANATQGEYGWDYKGSSHEAELAERLKMISHKVTRADAGQYLPPSERQTVLCNMSAEEAKRYQALEQANAVALKKALSADDPGVASVAVLKKLAAATTGAKLGTAVSRIQYHCEERGVKALVFATFHDSLKQLWETLEPDVGQGPLEVPVYCAGGWMLPDKRRKVIDEWRKCRGPAVLLANTLSSGIGIDLSDADVAIFLELCWVPADFVQAEGRIQDIHQGKRTSPPLYEYLLCKGTVDADMGLALVNKQNVINAVVGRDAESAGVVNALRGSGAVDASRLTLDREDPMAVEAALDALQRRLLGLGEQDDVEADAARRVALAADVESAFTEDTDDTDQQSDEVGVDAASD